MPLAGPINFPVVPPIASDALTIFDANNIFQSAAQAIMQIDPNTDTQAFYKVRTAFPQTGAPAFKITDDVVFVIPKPIDDDYNRVRDEAYQNISNELVQKQINYTRAWEVSLSVWGPNSLDNWRALRSGFLDTQEIHDFLATQGGLYIIPDIPEPMRAPENFEGQWWERVEGVMRFYEAVSETVDYQSVASVEVIVQESDKGILADITIAEPSS